MDPTSVAGAGWIDSNQPVRGDHEKKHQKENLQRFWLPGRNRAEGS